MSPFYLSSQSKIAKSGSWAAGTSLFCKFLIKRSQGLNPEPANQECDALALVLVELIASPWRENLRSRAPGYLVILLYSSTKQMFLSQDCVNNFALVMFWQFQNAGMIELSPEHAVLCQEAHELLTVLFAINPHWLEALNKVKSWQIYVIDLLLLCPNKSVWILNFCACLISRYLSSFLVL